VFLGTAWRVGDIGVILRSLGPAEKNDRGKIKKGKS